MAALIEAKDLVKVYKTGFSEVIALRGLTCEINEGEIVAIMGPSGCGKTTLLNLIGGLDTPTSGNLFVDGVFLANYSEGELTDYRRHKVGFVFQFFNLVPSLTGRENIELPMRLAGRSSAERQRRTNDLLAEIGLEKRAEHRPDELSGGEQQRIAIATALANDPKIILADEPTGELDTETGREILNMFKDLSTKEGKTIVIVSHDERVASIADRTFHILDGALVSE